MPRVQWGAFEPLVPVEKLLKERLNKPITVFIAGFNYSKPDGGLWGYVRTSDDDTLLLESGSGRQYTIRVSDISMVLVDK